MAAFAESVFVKLHKHDYSSHKLSRESSVGSWYISEVKHDVYDKRQTVKMKLLPSLSSCVYSRVKLFVFAMNSRRRCSVSVCFIYGLEEKNSNIVQNAATHPGFLIRLSAKFEKRPPHKRTDIQRKWW